MSWFKKSNAGSESTSDLVNSNLYSEKTFYGKFERDLLEAKEEAIIESPYITIPRLNKLKYAFKRLVDRGVEVFIVTRNPLEHDQAMAEQSEAGIRYFEALGVQVLLVSGGHHRKLAMIDRKLLWEGSLNILSQSHSREFMRRIESEALTNEMFKFLRYDEVGFIKTD